MQVSRLMPLWAFVLVVAWHLAACTNAELECSSDRCHSDPAVVALTGRACTVEPRPVLYPYKILFVIDVSGSNTTTDPNDDRARAALQVIDSYIQNRAVSFGVIVFGNVGGDGTGAAGAKQVTAGFTRDYDTLVPNAIDALKQKDGNTPYSAALSAVLDMLKADVNETPALLVPRMRYDIEWLSDGIPTDGTTTAMAVEWVTKLRDFRREKNLFDLRLSTVHLVGGGGSSAAEEILRAMATEGHGTYQKMSADDLSFKIDFTEILRPFERRSFFVVNESRQVISGKILPDSDRDGVPDGDDSRPLTPDGNADGCSDLVDKRMAPNSGLCPTICLSEIRDSGLSGADGLADSDNDGIPDCAEKALGYKFDEIDSDRDGFQDSVELRFGTNGLSANPFLDDSDKDGVSDGDEIITGTDPFWPEDAKARQELALQYSPLTYLNDDSSGDAQCFSFAVRNIGLVETQATSSTKAGENTICAYISQTPVDDPGAARTVTRACTKASVRTIDQSVVREPSSGEIVLRPEDFQDMVLLH
jgi:hypothetical protein